MKKIITIVIYFSVFVSLLSKNLKESTYTDNYGNTILKKEYNKIIITDPASLEIFYLIKAEEKIVGISKTKINEMWPKEKIKKLESVGTISKPSIEKIIKLKPDLVILNLMSREIEEVLKKQNIKYIITKTKSFEDIFKNIKLYGELTKKEKEANLLIENNKLKLSNLKNKISKKLTSSTGLVIYSTKPMQAYNSKTIPGEILNLFQINNLGSDSLGKTRILSPEYIIKNNPDFIICTMKIINIENLVKENPYIKYTNAYKNNKIYVFRSNKILRGSPRIFNSLEEIYEVIYNEKK